MSELELTSPEALGLCPARWQRVLDTVAEMCRQQVFPAFSLQVQRAGKTTGPHHFGRLHLQQSTPVDEHSLYLVASLTKPMVAMATLMLAERGRLSLNQPVQMWIPEFRDAAKRAITIKHLLTHTSGLPDMLPNNAELRAAHAPLEQFVAETCQCELLFPPGRSAQYQSMGYALMGAIIAAASGMSCRDFLHHELFAPLGMKRSWLGLPPQGPEHLQVAELRLSESQQAASDWNWNSRYWRELGAPWGGVLTNVSDLSRFLRMMLHSSGRQSAYALLSPSTIRESLENRLHDFSSIPDSERRCRGWGLGWRLNWKDHRHGFCDLLPADVAGHWGASGTLFWVDRPRELGVVLLTTSPLDDAASPLTTISNMIAAAFLDDTRPRPMMDDQ